jgi:hypothetical protein
VEYVTIEFTERVSSGLNWNILPSQACLAGIEFFHPSELRGIGWGKTIHLDMDVIQTCASGVFAHSGQYSLKKGEVDFVYVLFFDSTGI